MPDTAGNTPANRKQVLNSLTWVQPARKDGPGVSLFDFLASLQLLAMEDISPQTASAANWGEPAASSVQVVKSGVLAIMRWRTRTCAAASGMTGLLAIAAGLVTSIQRALTIPVTVALIGGGSLVLCATAIAIALYAHGNLEARGRATAARYTASAELAGTFLQMTAAASQPGSGAPHPGIPPEILFALAESPETVAVATKGHPQPRTVAGLRHDRDEGVQVQLSDNDWIPVSQVDHWSSRRS
jgi:hypothetical protein